MRLNLNILFIKLQLGCQPLALMFQGQLLNGKINHLHVGTHQGHYAMHLIEFEFLKSTNCNVKTKN